MVALFYPKVKLIALSHLPNCHLDDIGKYYWNKFECVVLVNKVQWGDYVALVQYVQWFVCVN
jgi:hypothetical protein